MKARRGLDRFTDYKWEMSNEQLASIAGLDPKKIVRMDTNTSPFRPESAVKDLMAKLPTMMVNQYPDTSYIGLRRLLAKYSSMDEDRFVVTHGADEALDIVAKAYLDPGDEAIVVAPTYGVFAIVVQLMSGKVRVVKRDKDFGVDSHGLAKACTDRTKLVFLCNPNNPTGNSMPPEEIASIAEASNAVVAVDEAYYEFYGKTVARLSDKHDNVISVRTFSKAFSMAGVRVGYIIGHKETVAQLNRVRPPNSLGVISLELSQAAMRDLGSMKRNVGLIIKEREELRRRLAQFSELEVYPSETNFLLFRLKKGRANDVHAQLMRQGFVLRNVSDVEGLENCLRLSVCVPEADEAFLSALKRVLNA